MGGKMKRLLKWFDGHIVEITFSCFVLALIMWTILELER